MNTNEIFSYLHFMFRNKLYGRVYYDVIPSDYLVNYVNIFPLYLVVNSERKNHPGKHWVCIVKKSKSTPIEFFCSYGNAISDYNSDFVNFVASMPNDVNKTVVHRDMQIQNFGSNCCGQYCILYIARRFKNCTRDAFYNSFSMLKLKNNDKIAKSFVNIYNPLLHGSLCKFNKNHVQCCNKFI